MCIDHPSLSYIVRVGDHEIREREDGSKLSRLAIETLKGLGFEASIFPHDPREEKKKKTLSPTR